MYAPETILERSEPYDEDDPRAAYNEVKVIGPSPITHAGPMAAIWAATPGGAQGVILQPTGRTGFAGTVDLPMAQCQEDYIVTEEPEIAEVEVGIKVRQYSATTAQAGRTPEEVFAAEASVPDPVDPNAKPELTTSPAVQQ